MDFLKWLFGVFFARGASPAKPPAPVADKVLSATRASAAAAITALRNRREEVRRSQEEARRRNEEEKKRRDQEAPGMLCEEPSAFKAPISSGIRRSVGHVRTEIAGNLATFDPRAFSRLVLQGVKDIYGGNPVPFYTAAELSRSAYSKLMSFPDRHPSKETVLAMAAALKMDLPEAESFLRVSGYALSQNIPSDLVWRACFAGGVHHLPQIRRLLEEFAEH